MHQHTPQTMEMVTLYAADASANGRVAAESQIVERLARRLGLDRARLSAVQAVMTWAVFLRPSTDRDDRERLRDYLDVMGYLPADRKVVAHAERSGHAIEAALPALLKSFARGSLDAEAFLVEDAERLAQRFAGLTRSQLDLLKAILRHQRALDEADLRDLIAQFPFPIAPVNFFGRFIAGGCDDPRKAIRYLRLCTPFFVRLRSLQEGLSNDRFRFLVIQGINAVKEDTAEEVEENGDATPANKPASAAQSAAALDKEAANLLYAAIDTAHDFLGATDGPLSTPFACIKVPELPSFVTDHIDRDEQAQLAMEFIDWLLTGNGEGPLLHRKALSVESERDYRKTKRELRQARNKRKKHHSAPADQENRKAMSIWEREDARLAKAIEELENKVKQADRERAKRRTILQQLDAAAQHARMEGYRGLTEQDIAAAAPAIFHLPDGEQIRHRKTAVDKFLDRAPFEVLGQEQAIRTIGGRMKSHVLGVRDVDRPLALLLPGPTGVGKTELMMKFALAMNMPFFHVEGAQFSESHTVARLIGSPSGYVGPDKGILYVFAEENAAAIVFFDEIEKMHPDVYTALMNYFDAGILTAGNGETVRRPGHVIVGAANAGAERLHRLMSERQVKDVLAEAFTDRYGNRRPELVRRFEAIPMLALEKEHFVAVLRAGLETLGKRFGFINANMRLVAVEDTAVDLLYEASREVCAYSEAGLRRLGFGDGAPGVHVRTPAQLAAEQQLFFDMRHVSRAFEQLGGESVRQLAEEQYDRGWHRRRQHPRRVKLVGDPVRGRIVLVDVKETNGQACNGRRESVR